MPTTGSSWRHDEVMRSGEERERGPIESPFGLLTPTDWDVWQSEPLTTLLFPSPLRIFFPIESDDQDAPSPDLMAAAERFVRLPPAVLSARPVLDALREHYEEGRSFFAPDSEVVTDTTKLWHHVVPAVASLRRETGTAYVIVECNCFWELEHGLQLVFKEGHDLTRLSEYDDHVTGRGEVDTGSTRQGLRSRLRRRNR